GAPRPSHLRRRSLRLHSHVRQRHRPARPLADFSAPGALRADHADRRRAALVAASLRLSAARGAAMSEPRLEAIREIIPEDVGSRGLRTDPNDNLITRTAGDFETACRSIAETPKSAVGIVTGFYIPHAEPSSSETDGPLGAVFLARALTPLGIRVVIITDHFCRKALESGLEICRFGRMGQSLQRVVPVLTVPPARHPWEVWLKLDW